MEFSLKTTIEEDLQYLIDAKGGQEWLFNHYIALYPCNEGWYQLIYDGHQVCYGTLEEINAVTKAWCRIVDIENEEESE